MCEATAYLLKDGEEELLLAAVDLIEPEGEGLRLVSIFGEQKVVQADIHRLNLMNNKINLRRLVTYQVMKACHPPGEEYTFMAFLFG